MKDFFKRFFFKEEPQIQPDPDSYREKQPVRVNDNLFTCHHCQHQFKVQTKDIFPTSVRLLYKDQFVTGKGVMCPMCKQNSIFG